VLLAALLLLKARQDGKTNNMQWLKNAVVIFVVVLVANWLTANMNVFDNAFANLFFWALVLAVFVGSLGFYTGSRNRV
jgi:hypothetical protein